MHLAEIRKGVKAEEKKSKLEPGSTPTSTGLEEGKEPAKREGPQMITGPGR